MYIRKTISKQRGKTYTNYLLVESVSTPKGPRQKTICSLGDLSPRPASQWLKLAHKIESALAGQCELIEDTDKETKEIIEKVKERINKDKVARGDEETISLQVDKVETAQHREGGSVHVGYEFWKKLEMGKRQGVRIIMCLREERKEDTNWIKRHLR